MKAINAQSLSAAGAHKRIGPNTRSHLANRAIELEPLVEAASPLPCTFDVQPIHPPYFFEFAYFDVFGGLQVTPMSAEVGARVVERAYRDTPFDDLVARRVLDGLSDKYNLSDKITYEGAEKIVFLPGGNLAWSVDRARLDAVLFDDPEVVIKPHPITADDYIRHLGIAYGYARIIPPGESGYAYFKGCRQLWTGWNSELGLMAALSKKPFDHITSAPVFHKMTYASLYRLMDFRGDVEANYNTISRVLAARSSGVVTAWHDSPVERLAAFFDLAMSIRETFKPSYPGLMFREQKG